MALKKHFPWTMRTNDSSLYGIDLAERVADYLVRVGDIKHEHKDYCGMALGHRDGEFIYGEVYDGVFPSDEKVTRFPDKTAFIEWLARQSDRSLSGAERDDGFYPNNQRVTRKRLLQHIDEK
jgi:hypothetical protein